MVQLVIYQLNTYNVFELLHPGALVFVFWSRECNNWPPNVMLFEKLVTNCTIFIDYL